MNQTEYFKDFVFEDINQLAISTLDYHNRRDGKKAERIVEGRKSIAGFSKAYLKRISPNLPSGMETKIADKIEILENSEPEKTIILMSAHQPNLFAYSGILKKIALIKALEENISKQNKDAQIICFYGIADHDFVHNKWVRSAEMPAPLRKDGVLRFNIDLPKKDLFLPTNMIAKPSMEKLESWHMQINGWMSENCSLAMRYAKSANMPAAQKNIQEIAKNNFEEYWNYVKQAEQGATNLAEFSSFLLSTIANSVFETPVVVANFSDCFTSFGKEYQMLVSNSEEYSKIVSEDEKFLKSVSIDSGLSEDVGDLMPVWVKCSCGSKYKMSMTQNGLHGECMHCDSTVDYTKDDLITLIKSSPDIFQPRSISMLIAFTSAMDPSCYIAGSGGLGYLMHTKAVAKKFGMHLPPISYWNTPDDYISIESLAAARETQRISEFYKLSAQEISPESVGEAAGKASVELTKRIADGAVTKSAVSERDRQLLETISKSLKMAACSIDYATNIGMGQAYNQWVDFLISGRKLQDTVKLSSILAQN